MLKRLIIILSFVCVFLPVQKATADDLKPAGSAFEQGILYFYAGDYHAETTENQLESPGSEFALGMGVLFDYTEYFDWGFDAIVVSRDYDTPPTISGGPFTVVSDDMSLSTLGLTLAARINYPAGMVNVYAGAGTGLYLSRLTLTASTFGLIGSHEERSTDFGYFYNYGITLKVSNQNYLGLEYRNLFLDAGFPPVTSGAVDIGGDFLLMSYTAAF